MPPTQPIPTWYKPSPLWSIPQDWEISELNKICTLKKWEQLNKIWLSKSNIYPAYSWWVTPSWYTEKRNTQENTITISEWWNSCWFVNFIKTKFWSWWHCYTINDIKLDKLFLYQILKYYENKIMRLRVGSGLPNIQKNDLLNFEIIYPKSLPEQTAISTILSTIDTTIQQTQEIIRKFSLRNKGLQQNLLTGKVRMKGFSWKFKKLNADDIFRPISIKNLSNEQLLSATQDQWIIPRDMLQWRVTMPTTEANSYKLVVPWNFIISLRSFQWWLEYSEYRWIVSPAYTVLEPIVPIDDNFYKYYFKSYDFIGHLAVAVIWIRDWKQISFDDFCTLDLPYPDIEEQKAIANLLNKANQEINQYKQKLEKLQTLKKGLMQQLLTGKVRVKEFRK